jgi:hypothetical protein
MFPFYYLFQRLNGLQLLEIYGAFYIGLVELLEY